MTYQNQSCVDACTECISVAAYCSQACIEEQMAECAKHCLECVEICKTLAVLAARDSMNVSAVAEACAQICDACAEVCEKHDNDHCKACADACRKCADECRKLAGGEHKKKAA